MKLLDQREVLVPGHDGGDGHQHLLLLSGVPAVRAAMGYVAAVRRSLFVDPPSPPTAR